MTARQVFEYALIELNKVKAPSMLLEDFNYFFNKGIYQFINKVYNIYDLNLQTTDEIRVLKSTTVLTPTKTSTSTSKLYGNFYLAQLPADYYHVLNCICEFNPTKNFKCYNKDVPVYFSATKLTADMWSLVINNFYMRPMYKRPYYFIHNTNAIITASQTTNPSLPTNPYIADASLTTSGLGKGTDQNNDYTTPAYTQNAGSATIIPKPVANSNLSRTINMNGTKHSVVEKDIGVRYGNGSEANIEIRYGIDDTLFVLKKIYVDYLKTPQNIRLTQDQIDLVEDFSQIIEFSDFVCYEIINELVKLLLENSSDPRLQSNIPINQSIAQPEPAQAQQGRSR